MPKSQIIKDLVEGSVSLEQSLRRLQVLALDIKNKPLADWAEKELVGYEKTDTLPEYRKSKGGLIKYTGFNGLLNVKNAPFQLEWLSQKTRDQICALSFYEGISFLCTAVTSSGKMGRDLSFLAAEVGENTDFHINCISITQVIPESILQKICAEITQKMLSALVELEKNYGCLDSLGIDVSRKSNKTIAALNDEINKSVLNVVISNPNETKEKLPSKIGWNIIVPIITGVAGAIIATILSSIIGI